MCHRQKQYPRQSTFTLAKATAIQQTLNRQSTLPRSTRVRFQSRSTDIWPKSAWAGTLDGLEVHGLSLERRLDSLETPLSSSRIADIHIMSTSALAQISRKP